MSLFGFSVSQIELLLLLFVRVGGMIVTAPVFNSSRVPLQLRAGLSLIVALLLMPSVERQSAPINASLPLFTLLLGKEALVGALLGYTANLVISIVQIAGELQDTQAGYGFAGVVDPNASHDSAILGQLQMVLMWIVFLLLNGHHMLLRALAGSYAVIPIGAFNLQGGIAWYMAHLAVEMTYIALSIGAPVICAVMMTDIALGILQRTAPQLNLFAVGFQVKTTVAVLALTLALPFIGHRFGLLIPTMGGMMQDVLQYGR